VRIQQRLNFPTEIGVVLTGFVQEADASRFRPIEGRVKEVTHTPKSISVGTHLKAFLIEPASPRVN
jgi:hypothetical protein